MISSYFISQINLRSSTEIFCVLIAPVQTSENLASAPALDAAPLGDAPGGHGTARPAWQALPPVRPGTLPVGAPPAQPPAQFSLGATTATPSSLLLRPPPRHGGWGPWPLLPTRPSAQPPLWPRSGSPAPRAAPILTGCGGFLGAGPLRADVALQHGADRRPAPVRPGRARSWRGADGDSEGQGPSPAQEGTVPSPPQRRDAKPRAPEPTWPPSRTAAPLLPLGLLVRGSRAGLPAPELPAGRRPRPAPRPHGRPASERRGTLEKAAARPAGPARPRPPAVRATPPGSPDPLIGPAGQWGPRRRGGRAPSLGPRGAQRRAGGGVVGGPARSPPPPPTPGSLSSEEWERELGFRRSGMEAHCWVSVELGDPDEVGSALGAGGWGGGGILGPGGCS